ncbi:unnamed protein product [Trichogramma brassicae]|uniref:Uncharacterized protein n=1 Tax=Trichogramma brassicae TaxID=86971 RepID=A0A6H5J991_9HYME|nr:unnamed protein product [Trichogramma brassicae]
MATGTNNGKVRTRAQVEQFKQRMEALVRLEAPSMVWAKIRELPIQAVMGEAAAASTKHKRRRRDTASATVSSTMQGVAE